MLLQSPYFPSDYIATLFVRDRLLTELMTSIDILYIDRILDVICCIRSEETLIPAFSMTNSNLRAADEQSRDRC
jgi:hypothetical protein